MSAPVRERAGSRRGERSAPTRTRRFIRRLGWTLIAIGVFLGLFVVYELFVTNLITDRYQAGLREDLDRQFTAPVRAEGETDGGGDLPPLPKPVEGEAFAILRIPKIGLTMAVVEGVGVEELKKGPGHYPGTPVPGQQGNVGIAGHRTTYGKPFWSLDRLRPGDNIFLRTRQGSFHYEVVWQRVVDPSRRRVLSPTSSPSITLTTCNPRFSAAERLIVRGALVDGPAGTKGA